jgi:hypothetical protein
MIEEWADYIPRIVHSRERAFAHTTGADLPGDFVDAEEACLR